MSHLTRFECPPESWASSCNVLKIGPHYSICFDCATASPSSWRKGCISIIKCAKKTLSKTGAYQRQNSVCYVSVCLFLFLWHRHRQTETLGLAHLVLRILTCLLTYLVVMILARSLCAQMHLLMYARIFIWNPLCGVWARTNHQLRLCSHAHTTAWKNIQQMHEMCARRTRLAASMAAAILLAALPATCLSAAHIVGRTTCYVQTPKSINLFASFSPSPSFLCKLVDDVPSSGMKRLAGTRTLHMGLQPFKSQVTSRVKLCLLSCFSLSRFLSCFMLLTFHTVVHTFSSMQLDQALGVTSTGSSPKAKLSLLW